MKFPSILQSFGFTHGEVKVVLALTAAFLIGIALRLFRDTGHDGAGSGQRFDYSAVDSIFLERSRTSPLSDESSARRSDTLADRSLSRRRPVNINTATRRELVQLPGIGHTYADRIIEYRTANGPFRSVNELERVKGIGKKTLERLRPLVAVQEVR